MSTRGTEGVQTWYRRLTVTSSSHSAYLLSTSLTIGRECTLASGQFLTILSELTAPHPSSIPAVRPLARKKKIVSSPGNFYQNPTEINFKHRLELMKSILQNEVHMTPHTCQTDFFVFLYLWQFGKITKYLSLSIAEWVLQSPFRVITCFISFEQVRKKIWFCEKITSSCFFFKVDPLQNEGG